MTPICESNFSLGVSCVLFFSLVMYLELVSHLFLVITDEGVETWKGWQHTEGCSALKYQGRGLTCLVLVQESEMRVVGGGEEEAMLGNLVMQVSVWYIVPGHDVTGCQKALR